MLVLNNLYIKYISVKYAVPVIWSGFYKIGTKTVILIERFLTSGGIWLLKVRVGPRYLQIFIFP